MLPCPAIMRVLPCLIVSCFILFGCCLVLKRKQLWGRESDGERRWEELKGAERGEPLAGMHYMREESILNKTIKTSCLNIESRRRKGKVFVCKTHLTTVKFQMKNQSLEEQSITSAQETSQEEYDRLQSNQK